MSWQVNHLLCLLFHGRMKEDRLILVDRNGRKTGEGNKTKVHRKGLLHRAFSIFLYNKEGEMLLQRRACTKYHFAGLWSNACCSHPRPGEKTISAAHRRLMEELGISSKLEKRRHVLYRFYDQVSGLTEHEYDFIFTGEFDGFVPFNEEEVSEVRWISSQQLKAELKRNPEKFTPWFKEILRQISP